MLEVKDSYVIYTLEIKAGSLWESRKQPRLSVRPVLQTVYTRFAALIIDLRCMPLFAYQIRLRKAPHGSLAPAKP